MTATMWNKIMGTGFALAIAFVFSFALPQHLQAQIPGEDGGLWRTLAKLSYEKQYNDMFGFEIDMPVFSDEIKALEDQEVMIRGYIIPVEGYRNHKEFIFSAYPYSQCFFCGAAGPETVMEIYAEKPVRFTSEMIWLKGKLVHTRRCKTGVRTGEVNAAL
jgi:hypothetical protein